MKSVDKTTTGLGLTATKLFTNFPCTHRAWAHEGHCRFLHGYSRSFKFWFACKTLTHEGFVVDFGDLKLLREYLEYMFDHTTLINQDDPVLALFKVLNEKEIIQLRVVENCSMEGSAKMVCAWINNHLIGSPAWCYRVEARENDKNSAMYEVREG